MSEQRVVTFPGRLRKVGADDPTYWLEVAVENGAATRRTWVAASATTLLSWNRMKAAIFQKTDVVPVLELPKKTGPQEFWEGLINEWTQTIEHEEAPAEASESGLVLDQCLEFVSALGRAEKAAEFEQGNWRYETPETGLTAIRSRDLRRHLAGDGKIPPPRELWAILEPAGFAEGWVKIERKVFRVWTIPTAAVARWLAENRRGVEAEVSEVSAGSRNGSADSYTGHGVTGSRPDDELPF